MPVSTPRLDKLLRLAQAEPNDAFVQYGLALEYMQLERWADAVATLDRTLALKPDDVAALLQKGRALVKLGQPVAARAAWSAGIAAAERAGDLHAASELRGLLEALG